VSVTDLDGVSQAAAGAIIAILVVCIVVVGLVIESAFAFFGEHPAATPIQPAREEKEHGAWNTSWEMAAYYSRFFRDGQAWRIQRPIGRFYAAIWKKPF
jgi:flagellar basal body-associated protein FliL